MTRLSSIRKARCVQEWLPGHRRVGLYYLPCYRPDLNLVEKIWWRMKAVVTANRLYGSMKALIESVETFFKELTESEVLTLAA
jgi:transposase